MRDLTDGRPDSRLFKQILSDGYGNVHLDTHQARTLRDLHHSSMEFFALDSTEKLRHSTSRRNVGYRTYGHAYAQSPDHPDLNDSFLYWPNTAEKLSHPDEIGSFLHRLEDYRLVVTRLVRDLIDDMRSHYDYRPGLPFEDASFIQVNSFPIEPEEELLQEAHEDAVFLTVIWTSAPGLEMLLDGTTIPVAFGLDELLVMPGSVMTDMTGGEVPPLFHQARNHGHEARKSIMYFVSPEVDEPIAPFTVNDYNREMDIRERVVKNPQEFFGLSEDFIRP